MSGNSLRSPAAAVSKGTVKRIAMPRLHSLARLTVNDIAKQLCDLDYVRTPVPPYPEA